jgi:hypothetical protein
MITKFLDLFAPGNRKVSLQWGIEYSPCSCSVGRHLTDQGQLQTHITTNMLLSHKYKYDDFFP